MPSIMPRDVARVVGISEQQLLRRLDTANVTVSSLSYDDNTHEFTAYMSGGQKKIMYIVETPRGRGAFFGSRGALNHMKNNPDLYPHLQESATAVYIPVLISIEGRTDVLAGRIDLL
jgi:hypothetical protein